MEKRPLRGFLFSRFLERSVFSSFYRMGLPLAAAERPERSD
jgi:hypothetical protein